MGWTVVLCVRWRIFVGGRYAIVGILSCRLWNLNFDGFWFVWFLTEM